MIFNWFTHHNFAVSLRDKEKRAVLLQLNTSRSPEMPSGGPVGMTLKFAYWD
jgi:hypothetical protein